ncbi:MAG: plastocyanin/azurin family copper-binding protein [Gemmatimonadetes bacterium]|nr:plastocyanin/azurin family copper-binding protein [Gemmatimonadota bacterium]
MARDGRPTVVLLEPLAPQADFEPPAEVGMDQFAMAFFPASLYVRTGQTVVFSNSEEVAHNVKVRSVERDSTLFNVGTVTGDPYRHTFDEPGGYQVTCDIHPGMHGFILVADAPYGTIATGDGSFAFRDVPEGAYRLIVWSADSTARTERQITVRSQGEVLNVNLVR